MKHRKSFEKKLQNIFHGEKLPNGYFSSRIFLLLKYDQNGLNSKNHGKSS